ncbi:MAG TPA: hypothetical protein VFZ98_12285 [Vicinamibacterales bacterium]
MAVSPVEVTLELTPRARFDIIDVRERLRAVHGSLLDAYPHHLYHSFHTTAGYLEQSLASRLTRDTSTIAPYVEVFRAMFPEGAGYEHDRLERRKDLTSEERRVEPRNADSHLAFMAAGLSTCVSYVNRPQEPVAFVDLDGLMEGRPRRRLTSIVGFMRERDVQRLRLAVPVSQHPIDSVNLKDPKLGIYEQIIALVKEHGIVSGRVRLELAGAERQAGLTVNEYETLLMRHDLAEVLRNPFRFAAEKGRELLAHPRAIPAKALDYAKYDMVRALNRVLDVTGLRESLLERLFARAIAVPAGRFLRMKRSVNLRVRESDGQGVIADGRYQSPILVQWNRADRHVREIEATLTSFE